MTNLDNMGIIRKRFLQKVSKTPGCWLWMGTRNSPTKRKLLPYGIVIINGKRNRAHRVSWLLRGGRIPVGTFVLHKCDVPYCVRPAHLYLGTAKDNARDMVIRGRQFVTRGESSNLARLRTDQVLLIKQMLRDGVFQSTIAKKFRIGQTTVSHINRGDSWAHLSH